MTVLDGHVVPAGAAARRARRFPSAPLAALLCVAPFVAKALHVDDPLFVWVARQIARTPADFYGFDVNWHGRLQPMFEVMHNPPGFSYLLAGWAAVVGWSPVALHLAVLLLAVLSAWGIQRLAVELGAEPHVAALAAVLSPAFVVCATTVMCDVLLLAAWTWAVLLWREGLRRESVLRIAGAMGCAAVAVLAKYFGIALLPLLLVDGLLRRGRSRAWCLALLLPLAVVVGYELLTRQLYGRGLITQAAAAAVSPLASGMTLASATLSGLAFTGGCIVALVGYAPWLWRRRTLFIGVALVVALAAGLLAAGTVGHHAFRSPAAWRVALAFQTALFAVAGLQFVALVAADLWRSRDADGVLLALWGLGTLAYACWFSQFVAARVLLPLAPVAGLLIARRLEWAARAPRSRVVRWLPLAFAGIVSLTVAGADYALAASARDAARRIETRLVERPGRVWFQGHWGFQFYMEQFGALPVVFRDADIRAGDHVVLPLNNTNVRDLDAAAIASTAELRYRPFPWMSTMNREAGAGFYSELWGPAPFVFGPTPTEIYRVHRVRGR